MCIYIGDRRWCTASKRYIVPPAEHTYLNYCAECAVHQHVYLTVTFPLFMAKQNRSTTKTFCGRYIYIYSSLGKNERLECHVTVHNNNKYSLPIFVVFVSSHLKPMGLNVSSILPVVTKDLPISPRFTLYEVLSRCKFSTRLQLVNQWLHLTNSRSHGFRYVRSHTFFFYKDRTHGFRTRLVGVQVTY